MMTDISDFLEWWLAKPRLSLRSQGILDGYYGNYRKRFDGYIKAAFADRHRELNQISLPKDARVLDVGCGTGTVALYVAYKTKAKVLGIDIDADRLDCAKERRDVWSLPKCTFLLRNIINLDGPNKFDLIYLEEALHHMEPRAEAVRKIADLLRPGGKLIISEVNALNPLMQLRLFRQRGLKTITTKHGVPYGNERVLTAGRAIKLFKAEGLSLESKRYFRVFPAGKGNMQLDKALVKLPVSRLFTVHYNLVMTKDGL